MHGKKHGYGIFRWPDGRAYYGQWKEDKKDGYGYYSFTDDNEYYGEYKNDKRQNQGVEKENGILFTVKHQDGKRMLNQLY